MLVSILKFAAISICITAVLPFALIASQWPTVKAQAATTGLDFSQIQAQDLSTLPAPEMFEMLDGTMMPVRRYGDGGPLLVMVHGSSWHGMQFHGLATALADQAQVLVPDLRGHGVAPARRGDVDYIGQLEDDLADLITATAAPEQKVVMLGHSSGGGLVVRFAGGRHGSMIDHALLLAPFLKHNAPTTRVNSGGWANVLTRRIIGLSMLNTAKITDLNHLQVIQFNIAPRVQNGPLGHTVTAAYSYRMNASFAPRADYLKDVGALPAFSLIVGAQDEAFLADQYAPVMGAVTDKGRYVVLEGVTHLAVVDAPETLALIKEDLRGF